MTRGEQRSKTMWQNINCMKQVPLTLINCFRLNITRILYYIYMVLSVSVCVYEREKQDIYLSLSLFVFTHGQSMQIYRCTWNWKAWPWPDVMISLWINSMHQNIVTFCNRSVSTALTPVLSRPRFSNSARKSTTRKSANFFAPSPCVAILVENARMKRD